MFLMMKHFAQLQFRHPIQIGWHKFYSSVLEAIAQWNWLICWSVLRNVWNKRNVMSGVVTVTRVKVTGPICRDWYCSRWRVCNHTQ